MVNFNWFGAGIIILNIILTFLLSSMRRIKYKRGGAISGWISALIGVLILVYYKAPLFSTITTTLAIVFLIIVIFGILIIIIPISFGD